MCTSPLKGFPNGETKNGKTNYIICSSKVDHIEIINQSIKKIYDPFISSNASKVINHYTEIPCGQCLECRLEYSRQWANRCVLEASDHKDNCFITLTYDDINVPTNDSVNSLTGEITEVKTLRKDHLQLFMKRLRKELSKYDIKVRFFACGEYGGKTKRPHYHLILFGWKPDETDLQLVKKSDLGYNYYSSSLIEKLWPYGYNLVADCTWETCAYVARYVTKKVDISDDFYKDNNIQKEFITMSRRPGIGFNWYLSNNVCYATFSNNYIATDFGSRKISHNRYFDGHLEKENPELYEKMKETRKKFQNERKKMLIRSTDLDYLHMLDIKARNLKNRTKVLERNEI